MSDDTPEFDRSETDSVDARQLAFVALVAADDGATGRSKGEEAPSDGEPGDGGTEVDGRTQSGENPGSEPNAGRPDSTPGE